MLIPLQDLGAAGAAGARRRAGPSRAVPTEPAREEGAVGGAQAQLRPAPWPPPARGPTRLLRPTGPRAPPPAQASVPGPGLRAAANTRKAEGSRPDSGAVPAGAQGCRARPPAREGLGPASLPFPPPSLGC